MYLTRQGEQAYKRNKGGCMAGLRGRQPEVEEKKVVVLEFVAAFAILSIIALVLYMVFSYRPTA